MAKRIALIIIGHFKPEWGQLTAEEQTGFATRLSRAARRIGVTPVVGYTLTTEGSFLQIWEADEKATLDLFRQALDALGGKKYYDQALMVGERAEGWIESNGQPPRGAEQASEPEAEER